MKIGVIGGGINGVCVAWEAASRGHAVTLFERDRLMAHTSSASSKLLHGGLRYLELGEFALVGEALHEREWWLAHAGRDLAWPLDICLPIYRDSRRKRFWVGAGLWLYDRLAGQQAHARRRWLRKDALLASVPELASHGLLGGFTFIDGQMNDSELGRWAARKASEAGAELIEESDVERVSTDGTICLGDEARLHFDCVVNVCGPWARSLLERSGIPTDLDLSLVRGSHLLLDRPQAVGLMLEHPWDRRMFFVLPHGGQTLIGTTEVVQTLDQPVVCSKEEREYLLAGVNRYFRDSVAERDILRAFSGLRPLVRTDRSASRTSRQYVIERNGSLLSVFGGKWTTSRSLARRVVDVIESPAQYERGNDSLVSRRWNS
jgi:glycerol-3-phosphate dehydrogenase